MTSSRTVQYYGDKATNEFPTLGEGRSPQEVNTKQSVVMRSCLETRAAGQLDDEAIWRLEPGRSFAVLFDGASMCVAGS